MIRRAPPMDDRERSTPARRLAHAERQRGRGRETGAEREKGRLLKPFIL